MMHRHERRFYTAQGWFCRSSLCASTALGCIRGRCLQRLPQKAPLLHGRIRVHVKHATIIQGNPRLDTCPVRRDHLLGNIPPVGVRLPLANAAFTRATWCSSVVDHTERAIARTFSQCSLFPVACATAVYSSWKLEISAKTPLSGPRVPPLTRKV